MTLLEQEGFVRTLPRRGVFVVRKTKREIVEMIQVWAALESLAARIAATRATRGDRHTAAPLRRVRRGPDGHLAEYSEANMAFHKAIIRLGGNQLMPT